MKKIYNYRARLQSWGDAFADLFEGVGFAILHCLPHGVNYLFKPIAHRTGIVGFLRLVLGLSLMKTLFKEIAQYIFRPLGVVLGCLVGALLDLSMSGFEKVRLRSADSPDVIISMTKTTQAITHIITRFMDGCSLYALMGLVGSGIMVIWYPIIPVVQVIALGFGTALLCKLSVSISLFMGSHILFSIKDRKMRLNAYKAQSLNSALKKTIPLNLSVFLTTQIKILLISLYTETVLVNLEDFAKSALPTISDEALLRIERHIDYLTDRAISGDLHALHRLENGDIVAMIETLMDEAFKKTLKDKIDTLYDLWYFRSYRACASA